MAEVGLKIASQRERERMMETVLLLLSRVPDCMAVYMFIYVYAHMRSSQLLHSSTHTHTQGEDAASLGMVKHTQEALSNNNFPQISTRPLICRLPVVSGSFASGFCRRKIKHCFFCFGRGRVCANEENDWKRQNNCV